MMHVSTPKLVRSVASPLWRIALPIQRFPAQSNNNENYSLSSSALPHQRFLRRKLCPASALGESPSPALRGIYIVPAALLDLLQSNVGRSPLHAADLRGVGGTSSRYVLYH